MLRAQIDQMFARYARCLALVIFLLVASLTFTNLDIQGLYVNFRGSASFSLCSMCAVLS